MTLALVLALAVGGGCADARDTWTKGDRELNNQSLQGVRLQIAAIDELLPHVSGFVALGLAAIRSDLAIVELNLTKVEELHGPPPEVKPFSKEESAAARKKATEEHAKKGVLEWIYTIGGYLTVAAGIALTTLNLPVVGPYLATTKIGQVAARVLGGPIVKTGMDAMKGISQARAEAENQPLTAAKLLDIVVKASSPTSAKIADKVSDQIEAANKIEVTPIRELETTPS
ncbi:MAG TPA: hypothetical protein VJU16_05145 [Planctomycetota bacterium]|nr:hypothetical protein [Planctomycetota bacterium]